MLKNKIKIILNFSLFVFLFCFVLTAKAETSVEDYEDYTIGTELDDIYNDFSLSGSGVSGAHTTIQQNGVGGSKGIYYYSNQISGADGVNMRFASSSTYCFDIKFEDFTKTYQQVGGNFRLQIGNNTGSRRAVYLLYRLSLDVAGQIEVWKQDTSETLTHLNQGIYHEQCFYLDYEKEEYSYCSDRFNCTLDVSYPFYETYVDQQNIKAINIISYSNNDPQLKVYIDNMILGDNPAMFYDGISRDTTNLDYGLDPTSPDFNTVINQTCFIGDQCDLWFSFNDLAIGYPMYLLNYASSTVPENAIAETTVTASSFWQNKIIVPSETTEQTKKYSMMLDADTYGWVIESGIDITWMTYETWDDYIDDQIGEITEEYCSEDVVCSDVGGNANSFFFGVQCGLRRTLCWTFAPTESSKKSLMKSIESYEKTFPNNLYFDFVNLIEKEIKEVNTTAQDISIPFINSQGEYYMLPVVTSSTVSNALGTSFSVVYGGLVAFIWILTGLLVAFIVWKTIL